MEKQNERTREFAKKAAAESSAREYELFGAAERTAKFTAYLEKVVTHAKIDYLRHMEKLNGRAGLPALAGRPKLFEIFSGNTIVSDAP